MPLPGISHWSWMETGVRFTTTLTGSSEYCYYHDMKKKRQKQEEMATVTLPKYTCKRCGHQWIPRILTEPKTCPDCKSPLWNKDYQRKINPDGTWEKIEE